MKPRLTLEPYCKTGPLWWHCRVGDRYMSCAPTKEEAYAMWERHINPPPPRLTGWQQFKKDLRDIWNADIFARIA